jgi:exopolyphosphatase/guanosine-5'-triphosphate,3'-diphosphate pyrophosphatase
MVAEQTVPASTDRRVAERNGLLGAARPSFARKAGARKGPIAVVDVGSNSVRLVVFDGASRAPAYFFNEKVACGLGAEIGRTGRLAPAGVDSALDTLGRFAALADRMKVAALDAVATAAVRDAEDGPDFVKRVERETGLRLRVISGDEEARLAALGALVGEPMAEGAVADMGGASLELAAVGGGGVGARISLPLGPQRLDGLTGSALRKRIDAELAEAAALIDMEGRALFVVGGAWRAVAKLQLARTGHPLRVLHGYSFSAAEAAEAADWIQRQTPDALKALGGISSGRAATAPLAASVLARILALLKPAEVHVSAFGLREGVYFEQLPKAVRARDPLIDACARLESVQARFPGFGDELFAFMSSVLIDWSKRDRRLAHAACLLNDVNWRAHPDYRATSCFETVTRANLAGLDHRDRAFLALALMNRYGGGARGGDVDAVLSLLSEEERARARACGRAMRLGAMLSGSTPGALSDAALSVEPERLTLRLEDGERALGGAVVEKRLAALADALGRAPVFHR